VGGIVGIGQRLWRDMPSTVSRSVAREVEGVEYGFAEWMDRFAAALLIRPGRVALALSQIAVEDVGEIGCVLLGLGELIPCCDRTMLNRL